MSTPTRTRTRTRSICKAMTEQGSHSFEISGYSLHRGSHITSGTFSVGGHDWAFYPDGGSSLVHGNGGSSTQPYISIFLQGGQGPGHLRPEPGRPDHRAAVADGTPEPREFSYGDPSMYFPHSGFMRRAELEDSPLLRDDRLTIHCDVTVIKEPLVLTNMFSNEITVPPPNITEHLGRLLETGVGADVTFIVDGEILAAHKLVRATRSPVFMAEFLGPMKEAKETHVAIEDMRSDAFRALPLLHFIYTDSLPDTDDARGDAGTELIQHLLVAADRYDVDRLKLMCENMLCDGLDVWNVAELALDFANIITSMATPCMPEADQQTASRAASLITSFSHSQPSSSRIIPHSLGLRTLQP
ncbi:hypothetical protein C2845_PM14G05680 [Panicum miliaceum]|uniref:BTB domain-containing protein n=1 Tax=Panicum miliaceum TaxID=4540 RepID=A0A3L6PRG2_PANMI|nr:hypothetical protein C2845_PM14G05680 [Panicum miliaceum]